MAEIAKSTVCLRVYGDNLDPEVITKSLGCEPSFFQLKGQELLGPQPGRKHTAHTGMWRLEAKAQNPENINAQIEEILNQLAPDLKTWEVLNKQYQIDLFCGLFMDQHIEGIEMSPKSMKLLSERGVTIGFDIYGPDTSCQQTHAQSPES